MSADSRAVVQGAALVLGHRGVQTLAGLAFAALVPRTMGPARYGQYAVITSLAVLFAVVSGIGLTNATTRYLPTLAARGEPAALRRLVGNLLTVRVATGAVAALVYVLVTAVWWSDMDPVALGAMALSVWINGVAMFLFALFLGLDRAGQSALGESVRRWLLVGLVLLGFLLDGLRGAALGVLAAELGVLALGVWSMPVRVGRADLRPSLASVRPYLGYSAAFLVSNLLYMAFQGSGELLVRTFADDYAQAGYFALAHNMYVAAATAVPQLLLAFVPMFSALVDRGHAHALPQWNSRLLRYLAVAGVLGVFGAVFLGGSVVRVLFGTEYGPVASNLVVLSVAFLVATLGSVLGTLALVHERPRPLISASALRLALFWSAGSVLAARWGSLGASVAVLAAVIGHTGHLGWTLRDLHDRAVRQWLGPVAVGALFAPLGWLRLPGVPEVAIYAAFATAYAGALLLLRLVTVAECRALLALLRSRRPARPDDSRQSGAAGQP